MNNEAGPGQALADAVEPGQHLGHVPGERARVEDGVEVEPGAASASRSRNGVPSSQARCAFSCTMR